MTAQGITRRAFVAGATGAGLLASAPVFAGPGSFDRSVQSQQVRLFSDFLDNFCSRRYLLGLL